MKLNIILGAPAALVCFSILALPAVAHFKDLDQTQNQNNNNSNHSSNHVGNPDSLSAGGSTNLGGGSLGGGSLGGGKDEIVRTHHEVKQWDNPNTGPSFDQGGLGHHGGHHGLIQPLGQQWSNNGAQQINNGPITNHHSQHLGTGLPSQEIR